jgi:hypothetical protein
MTFTIKVSGAPPGAGYLFDHRCNNCDHIWELSFPTRAQHEPYAKVICDGEDSETRMIGQVCPECGSRNTYCTDATGAPPVLIVRGNHDFADRQGKRLHDRQIEHWRKEGRDEAIARTRDQVGKGWVP